MLNSLHLFCFKHVASGPNKSLVTVINHFLNPEILSRFSFSDRPEIDETSGCAGSRVTSGRQTVTAVFLTIQESGVAKRS